MFFVFAVGCPNEGACGGGLSDMKAALSNLNEAKRLGRPMQDATYDVEVLDGTNGDVWIIDRSGNWVLRA